jgi:hypothetical protein
MIVKRFDYKTLEKITYPSGARHYVCPETGVKLPSVTTILDKTSGEKKELLEWRKRVGDKEAERVKNEAMGLGTLMHAHLENHIIGIPRPGGNNTVRVLAEKMADQIILQGLVDVSEFFGSEIQLWYPGLYAGTTDSCGVYHGQPAILDFKSTKKIRTIDMINDYFLQLCGYILSHNELYGTNIKTGVIFMVSRDYDFKSFVLEGEEFHKKTDQWMDRLDMFFANQG